jgi:hypothetical protein
MWGGYKVIEHCRLNAYWQFIGKIWQMPPTTFEGHSEITDFTRYTNCDVETLKRKIWKNNKIQNGAVRNAVHRLYTGVLYFLQNLQFHVTRVSKTSFRSIRRVNEPHKFKTALCGRLVQRNSSEYSTAKRLYYRCKIFLSWTTSK